MHRHPIGFRRSASRLVLPAILAWASGCARDPQTEARQETILRSHEFVQASQPTKFLGEDCAQGGLSDCADGGMCVHGKAAASEGWVCSSLCSSDFDCPKGWTCFAPVGKRSACWPPTGFAAHRVVVRPSPAPPP